MTAYPAGETPSGGEGTTPQTANSVNVELDLDKPACVYVARYSLQGGSHWNTSAGMIGWDKYLNWLDGSGGILSEIYCDYDFDEDRIARTLSQTFWPPGTAVPIEQCSITGTIPYGAPAPDSPDDATTGTFWRDADSLVSLFTGGKSITGKKSLFRLTGAAWEQSGEYFTAGEPACGIFPEQITLGQFGPLDQDGTVYVALPDGLTVNVRPASAGYNNYGGTVSAAKYSFRLSLDGWGDDVADKSTNVWVGQKMHFTCRLDPPPPAGVFLTNIQWSVPGDISQRVAGYFTGDSPTWICSSNIPLTALDSSTLDFYWVDKMDGAVITCKATCLGEDYEAETTLSVLKPTADWIGVMHGPITNDTVNQELIYGTAEETDVAGMHFVFTNKNLAGYPGGYSFSFAQLMVYHMNVYGTNSAGDRLVVSFGTI